MSNGLSTAGVKLYYAPETVANTRPTTYTSQLAGLKEIPDMAPAPETLETTTLDALEYKTYINGLKDLGGSLGFTFNFTQAFISAWESMMTTFTGLGTGLGMWFKISIPGITKALYFKGIPTTLGMPGIGVNAVLEITAYITPNDGLIWA